MNSCYLILTTWYFFQCWMPNADWRMKKWKFVSHTNLVAQRSESRFLYLGSCLWVYFVPCTWYLVQWSLATWYWLLDTFFLMSNIERRMLNEEVGCWTKYEVLSTKYGAGFWSLSYFVPGTMNSCYLILTTWYFFQCWMPNADWRMKKWKFVSHTNLVAQRSESRFLYLGSCLWVYFVPCTSYKVLLLDTNYLILFFNVECRTPIGEWRSGFLNKVRSTKYKVWSSMLVLRLLGTLYFVLSTKSKYLILITWN